MIEGNFCILNTKIFVSYLSFYSIFLISQEFFKKFNYVLYIIINGKYARREPIF